MVMLSRVNLFRDNLRVPNMSTPVVPEKASSIFHSKRTAALVPKESHPRGKRALRNAIQEFADQFVNSLARLLIDFCGLRKSKTVDVNILTRAAEDLLGEGAAKLPRGVSKEDLPQTLIFSRFKRRLGGLRTEGACSELVSIIGFNFLRYVQNTLDSCFEGQDVKTVDVDSVVRALSQPRGFSRSGLPCIAYRPGMPSVPTDSQTRDEADVKSSAKEAAPTKAKKPKKSKAGEPEAVAAPAPEEAEEAKETKEAEAPPKAPKAPKAPKTPKAPKAPKESEESTSRKRPAATEEGAQPRKAPRKKEAKQ